MIEKGPMPFVLPGVGAFGKCVENLKRPIFFEFIKEMIIQEKLYLGICLGMQILFEESEEAPWRSRYGDNTWESLGL